MAGSDKPRSSAGSALTKTQRVAGWLLFASPVLSATGWYFAMLEFAGHMDGPGFGIAEPLMPLGMLVFLGGIVVFIVAAVLRRSLGHTLAAGSLGAVAFIALLALRVSQRIEAVVWEDRCASGDQRACYGLAGLLRGGPNPDVDRARSLDRETCDRGEDSSCFRMLWRDGDPFRAHACEVLAKRCEDDSKRVGSCDAVAKECGASEEPSRQPR